MAGSANNTLMTEEESKLLVTNANNLVENIRVTDGFLTALRTGEVFSNRQLERIERKYKSEGSAEAVEDILKLLDRASKGTFEGFKRALVVNDQPQIVTNFLTVQEVAVQPANPYQQENMNTQ